MFTHRVGDVDVIRDVVELPLGMGALNINAFVIHADQPVLVDTGQPVEKAAFQKALASVIDPADLRWIWITHPDRDHMGSLFDILDQAPQARLVTTFFAAGYMGVEFEVPMNRIQLVNPGQSLDVGGGRRLTAFRPPLFDSPMTVGFFDEGTGACVSSDCFGGILPVEAANAVDVTDIDGDTLRQGQIAWSISDSPWVANIDRDKFARSYERLVELAPSQIFSSHLPPATDGLDSFVQLLEVLPDAAEEPAPDQAALDAMLQQITEGAPFPH